MTNTDPYPIAIHTNERRARLAAEADEARLVRLARRATTRPGRRGPFRGLATTSPTLRPAAC